MAFKFFTAKGLPIDNLIKYLNESPEEAKNSLRLVEGDLLGAINWEVNSPTIYTFLLRYQKAGQLNSSAFNIASCISERCLLEYDLLQFKPSLLATTIVSMARRYSISSPMSFSGAATPMSPPTFSAARSGSFTFASTPVGNNNNSSPTNNIACWTATMQYYSGYTQDDIQPCLEKIQTIFLQETMNRARIFARQLLKEEGLLQSLFQEDLMNSSMNTCATEKENSQYFSLLVQLDQEVNILQEDINDLSQKNIEEIIHKLAIKTQTPSLYEKSMMEKKSLISDLRRKKLTRQQYLTYLPGILEFGGLKSDKYEHLMQLQTVMKDYSPIHEHEHDSSTRLRSNSGGLGMIPSTSSQQQMMLSEDSQFSATTDHSQSFDSQQEFQRMIYLSQPSNQSKQQQQQRPAVFTPSPTGKMLSTSLPAVDPSSSSPASAVNEGCLHQVIDDFLMNISDIPVIHESVRARFQKIYHRLITCPPQI